MKSFAETSLACSFRVAMNLEVPLAWLVPDALYDVSRHIFARVQPVFPVTSKDLSVVVCWLLLENSASPDVAILPSTNGSILDFS
jgi:hypothetical protein